MDNCKTLEELYKVVQQLPEVSSVEYDAKNDTWSIYYNKGIVIKNIEPTSFIPMLNHQKKKYETRT